MLRLLPGRHREVRMRRFGLNDRHLESPGDRRVARGGLAPQTPSWLCEEVSRGNTESPIRTGCGVGRRWLCRPSIGNGNAGREHSV